MSPAAFRRTVRVLALALFVALAPLVSEAATITVTSTADSGPNTLRDALSSANAGDTIVFSLTYPATITLQTELVIAKNLAINGPGADNLAISGNNVTRVFRVDAYYLTAAISGLTITNGRVGSGSDPGAGIYNAGTLTVSNCVLQLNKIAGSDSPYGGAIGNDGTLTVSNSSFGANSAVAGGAIMSRFGTVTVTGSLFAQNSAIGSGAGVSVGSAIVSANTTITIVNSTFTLNTSTPGNATVAIISGKLNVSNSTLAGNSADAGTGGIVADTGTVKIKGTILSNSGNECQVSAAGLTSLGYNLSDDASCATAFTQTGDLNGASPSLDLAGLKSNGGPTQTIALEGSSPAINAIPASACKDVAGNTLTTDQRGIARPQGAGCDIGAYEAPAPPPGPAVTCDAADGAWHAGDVSIHCTATAAGLANAGDATFYLMTSVAAGTEDANAPTDSRQVCDTLNRCVTAGPVGGNKVDRKPPSAACGEADGLWHSADVTVSCSPSDGGSGLGADGDASFRLSTTTAPGTETSNASTGTREICDAMGNCATAGPVGGHMIDKKAPAITIASPTNTSYGINQSVSASYTCIDGGSNVASCTGTVANGAGIDTSALGSKTFTVTAIDNAGNKSTQSVTYTIGYNVCLAYDPAKPVKGGATVAISVRLCNGAGATLSAPGVVIHATQVRGGSMVFPVQSPGNSQPGNNFTPDAGAFQFNLKTTGLAPGVYQLEFTVGADPVVRAAGFTVK